MITYKTMQIWVKKGHRMHPYFTEMCQNAKNMYNSTNFYIRQIFTGLTQEKELHPLQTEVLNTLQKHLPRMNDNQLLAYQKKIAKEKAKPVQKQKEVKCNLFEKPSKEKPYVDYHLLDALFKSISLNDYRSLPTQSSQGIMKTVFQNWKSFYASLKEYKMNPTKFKARPRIPGYSRSKEKEVLFSNQDCVIKENKFLKFPKTKEIDNVATIVTNTGRIPVLMKGKNIKSVNQRYNQLRAHFMGILRQGKNTNEGPFTSKRLEQINRKRFNQIKDLFHKASHQIEKIALEEDVDTIIIGQNKEWKQQSNMGKRNNQSFTAIPHSLLIQMIKYKAARHGIKVIVNEESYTSKASFLDHDEIPVYGEVDLKKSFSGKRMKRGLYCSKNGTIINADVNGAANIMRKVFPKAFNETFACVQALLQPISLLLK
ncbi:transposase [Alkalihalophilus pseudofirmus]|nr:transposase [Alkalihalophilus pseudofirmus]